MNLELGTLNSDLDLRLSSYDYPLPKESIAQTPVEPRDAARLLVLDRSTGSTAHHHVRDLPELLEPGDLVVANRTRVLPCRLRGTKVGTGGHIELTLLRPVTSHRWQALLKGHRIRPGQQVELRPGLLAEIGERTSDGSIVEFSGGDDVPALLHELGEMPLPPYIAHYRGNPERYQTVYADVEGSAAAPTAGLHFTPELVARLRDRGIGWRSLVLHIGLDTFRPITEEDIRQRHIHTEWVEVSAEIVDAVQVAHARHRRVVAVGTSTVRALEFAASSGELRACRGAAELFISPGYRFRVVDTLLTNFHMPRTSVLLLAAALAGRERVLQAYDEALRLGYRFLSFGDAMLIL